MSDRITVTVDDQEIIASPGETVAAAMMNAQLSIRTSVTEEVRAALCGMGICQECRIEVDGRPDVRACMTTVRAGMRVRRLRHD
jgi:predicted molibdopterin-dependent oxidoreductase YjgC